MEARVLVIEDEEEIAGLIGLYLNREGMEAELCSTAEKGLKQFNTGPFDLVVLDLNLPGMDGFEFLQTIRKDSNIPVIIVSARKADEDLILGLGIGADEFVVKPFSPKVLVARIRAILRRVSSSMQIKKQSLGFGEFTIDPEAYLLLKKGERIPLAAREFDLLAHLVMNPGQVFSAAEIYKQVWGKKYGDMATVAIHIRRLRKKIEKDPSHPIFIQNIYGAGYCFNKQMLITGKDNQL